MGNKLKKLMLEVKTSPLCVWFPSGQLNGNLAGKSSFCYWLYFFPTFWRLTTLWRSVDGPKVQPPPCVPGCVGVTGTITRNKVGMGL